MDNHKKENQKITIKKPLIEFNKIVDYLKKLLIKKYFVSQTLYQKYIIKNIIYDEKSRLVSTFKEYLIINDTSEFMKRYYAKNESTVRLKKYFEFYTNYSKLFPNYVPLCESKYIYKNIHKKQKLIDLQNDYIINKKEYIFTRNNENKILNSNIYESIAKNTENLNSFLFGLKNVEKNNSSSKIINIINSINKYEIEKEHEYPNSNKILNKYDKELENKNIIINNYYYNNSSILTKQSTIPSFIAHQKNNYTNNKMISIINNSNLIRLKKKKKNLGIKNSINNYTTFKDLNFFGLNNNNYEEDSMNKKNRKYNAEETNLSNYSKNNNSINYIKNYINNNNNSKVLKNNKQKSINYIPYTSRLNSSQNQKLMDAMKKLIGNLTVNNNNSKNFYTNKKSCIINLKGNINKNKIKFLLTNKMSHKKTNYLNDSSSHYNEIFNNDIKKKNNQNNNYLINQKLLKNSKKRKNNSDSNKIKKSNKKIDNNIYTKINPKKNNNVVNQKNYFNQLSKKNHIKNLAKKFFNLNSHKNDTNILDNNLLPHKQVLNKIKLDIFSNIKTERESERININNLKEFNNDKKIKGSLNNRTKKIRKTNSNSKGTNNKNLNCSKTRTNKNNKNISKIFNNNNIYNESETNSFITNSFLKWKNKNDSTFRRNIKTNFEPNIKNTKKIINKKLFFNHDFKKK